MPWRKIRGNNVWIGPKNGISSSDILDPRNPRKETSSFDDEYNRRRQEEFTKALKEKFEKRKEQSKAQKEQEQFNKLVHKPLGHAKIFLLSALPILAIAEPTIGTFYTTWKLGKYGYSFFTKVYQEYKITDDFASALLNTARSEINQNIISKVKSIPIKQASQFAAKRVWTYYKEKNPDHKIPAEWDKHVETAMAKTFEEIGTKVL